MLRSEGTPAPSVLKDDGYASAGFIVSSSFKGDNKKRRRERSIKRDLLNRHQASPGGGEELCPRPSHLLSRRMERERERERAREGDMKVGGGWERWRERSNSARRSNEHFLSVSQKCS